MNRETNENPNPPLADAAGSVPPTAEQWNEEYMQICANDPAVHGQLLPNPQNIAFIQRVIDAAEAHARREALMIATKAYRPIAPNDRVQRTAGQ